MAHGTADWGVSAASVTTFQLTDLGELAARLWSVDTFDRRGEVIFMEDFECGVARFNQTLDGTGAAIAVITTEARSGGNAIKLTSGSDAGKRANIYRYFHRTPPAAHGLEASARVIDDNAIVRLYMATNTGATRTEFLIEYDHAGKLIDAMFSDGSIDTIASPVHLPAFPNLFVPLKLVVNFITGQYVRAIVAGTQYDLSTVAGHTVNDASDPRITAIVECRTNSALNQAIIVDDWIVTQNEPV